MPAELLETVAPAERVRGINIAAIAVLLALVLPPAAIYFGVSLSLTLGAVVAYAIVIARPPTTIAGPRAVSFRNTQLVVIGVLAFLVFHLLVATLLGRTDLARAVGSLVPLGALLIAGGSLANALQAAPDTSLRNGLYGCFGVLCLMAACQLLGIAPPTPVEWKRPVLVFFEPSVFAIAFSPLFLFACSTLTGIKRACCFAFGCALTFMIQSLTLGAVCVLVALLAIRWWAALFVPLAFLGLLDLDLTYFANRVDVSDDNQNLSYLVYVQGWQMILEALQRTGGWGLGFQQLGVQGTNVAVAQLLRALRGGEDLNTLDGGFVLAKLAGEFGIIGIVFAIVFVFVAARSFFALRRIAARKALAPSAIVAAHCFVLSYLIELFVRGNGYFTSLSLPLVASLWLLSAPRSALGLR